MYIHTQKTCTQTHRDTCTHKDTCIHTHTCTYTHTHMYMHTQTHTNTHAHTQPYKKLQYFVVHSQSWVLHSRGRQRAQHTLLSLLSLSSAIEQSDGSQCE
ncbi:unnamed protein product [Staurois parvus]|uniref:Uncharacterized protein n=1 Tax=Staurois parvus TaxID=386267 RepID=A0ABN9EGN5_9NEOB|nr:unnamed protein product [Staurois parvus]